MKYAILGMILLILMPAVIGEVIEIPQGNTTINIVSYNISFDYELDEDKNLTIVELNTSKECDGVGYFDNEPFIAFEVSNDSDTKTYNITLVNGTVTIVGINASNYNTIEGTENCTFIGWNKTLGYAFFLFDNIGEEKFGIVRLKVVEETTSSTTTSTFSSSSSTITTSSYYHHTTSTTSAPTTYNDLAEGIKSEKIKEIVHKAKLIVGSEVDNDLSAKQLKDTVELVNKPLEIKEDCILVGGPIANPLVKKYAWTFRVKITNEYPGAHKGVIQKQLINGHTVILLAGSDRWGTKAAVEYFKTLDDLPDEPIFVQWKDGKAVKIEKP
jgi:hypothetical protein